MEYSDRFTFSRNYQKLMGINHTQLDDRQSMSYLESRIEQERQKKQMDVISRIEKEERKRVRKLLMLGYITDSNEGDYEDYFKSKHPIFRKNRRLSSGGNRSGTVTPITSLNDTARDEDRAWKVPERRKKPEDYRERNIMTYATPPQLPFLKNGTNAQQTQLTATSRVLRYRTETPGYSPDCARYPIMSPRRLSRCEKSEDEDDADEKDEQAREESGDKTQDDEAYDSVNDLDSSLLDYLRTYDDSLGRPPETADTEPWWTWTARKPRPPRSAIRFKYNGVSTTETRYIPPRTPEPIKEFLQTQKVADLYREAELLVGRR